MNDHNKTVIENIPKVTQMQLYLYEVKYFCRITHSFSNFFLLTKYFYFMYALPENKQRSWCWTNPPKQLGTNNRQIISPRATPVTSIGRTCSNSWWQHQIFLFAITVAVASLAGRKTDGHSQCNRKF